MFKKLSLFFVAIVSLFTSCSKSSSVTHNKEELRELIMYSYPYVVTYNVINNFISSGKILSEWNKMYKPEKLFDHTVNIVPRPNFDTLYPMLALDLRTEPLVIDLPAIDSEFVSLSVLSFDHSIELPLLSSNGDFTKANKIILYNPNTELYKDFDRGDFDQVIDLNGDIGILFLRVMPHFQDKERFQKNISSIQDIKVQTYSEYIGKVSPIYTPPKLPNYGSIDNIYKSHLFEIMSVIINHLSFHKDSKIDKKMLSILEKYGVKKGINYKKNKKIKIDGKELVQIMNAMRSEEFERYRNADINLINSLFLPNFQMKIENLFLETVIGPFGLPSSQAIYPEILTEDNQAINALNNYIISMSKDELPPVQAFWSITVYDLNTGLFIPNDEKKYSVGKNSGMVLNQSGGIDIYISDIQMDGVPKENWIPIQKEDRILDVKLRMYLPDLKKFVEWKKPFIRKI